MYMIWAGRVAVVKGGLDAPTIIGYRGPGVLIGEMALLEHQPRSATVIAIEPLRLLGLKRDKFQQIIANMPQVGLSIMEMLSARLRRSDEARSIGEVSEKRLVSQVTTLESEKQRLEELQRLRQETSDLIVHDLRNPLGTILASVQMLEMTLPEDVLQDNRELLGIAKSGCERLRRLVDTLLEVSRMESGESQMILSEFDLVTMLADVTGRVSILDRKGIDLQVRASAGRLTVAADRDKIERVLTNLLDNALKHTPEKGRIITAAETQGDEVYASITDSGPGIPAEERERIFERFAQVAGEKRQRRGFGLGLTYCRLAVEAHGGRIWVEPGEGGVGSRFVFTLPLKPAG
jgi:signal transduction histidine kinase